MKTLLAACGCGCLIASAAVFSPYTPYGELWIAVVLLVAGGVLVGGAVRQSGFDLSTPSLLGDASDARGSKPLAKLGWKVPEGTSEIEAQTEHQGRDAQVERMTVVHRVMAGAGVILLVLLAAINGKVLAATTDAQFVLLVAGVGLLILGFGAARLRIGRVDWLAVGIVTGLTVIALLLRLWQLNQTARFWVDELSYSTAVLNLMARDNVELLAPMEGTAAFPNLFAYFESKTVGVLGRNFAGFRAASALAGALSVPALYLLARALFKRRVALVAAALLVTFPPHLHFSRLGIIEATGALVGLVALAFLLSGFRDNRRLDFAAGGAFLGLTHYFHEGARVLYTPVAVVTLVLLVIVWRPPPRKLIQNMLLAGVLTVIVALPIYTTLALLHFSAAARFNTPYISLDGDYWRELLASGDFYWHIRWHILEPFLIFVHQPDRGLFYAGHTAMLLDWVVPAFLLGLCVVLWTWRRSLILIVWLLAVIFGNTLLMQSTIMTRYVVVFPVVMLLAALGIGTAVELIVPGRENSGQMPLQRSQRIFKLITIVGIVGVVSVAQVRYYFDWHVPLYNVQFRSGWGHRDAQDAVLRSLDFPAGTQIYIISRKEPDPYHTEGLLIFHRSDLALDLLRPEEVSDAFLSGLNREVDQAFFIDPNEPALVARLRAHFDMGELTFTFSPYDLPSRDQFALYYVEAAIP